MDFNELYKNYYYNEFIDLKSELTKKEVELLRKLEIVIKDGFYTEYEYDCLEMNLMKYYMDDSMEEKELRYIKSLEDKNINRVDYNKFLNKIKKIHNKYKVDLNFSERRTIVYDILNLLLKDSLSNGQKQKILKIVINLPKATELQKQRFILYYGLDITKTRRYNFNEISKMYACAPSAIRRSVLAIRTKFIVISKEEIEVVRNILDKI